MGFYAFSVNIINSLYNCRLSGNYKKRTIDFHNKVDTNFKIVSGTF